MPEKRPTASTINDEQLDALWAALEQLEALHREAPEYDGYGQPSPSGNCICGEPGPCTTMKIISRQRSIALESSICPKDGPDRKD